MRNCRNLESRSSEELDQIHKLLPAVLRRARTLGYDLDDEKCPLIKLSIRELWHLICVEGIRADDAYYWDSRKSETRQDIGG